MILSFHPCYETDTNMLCAGREPDENDLSAIRAADAIVLPQGCREALYRMARENCAHVFPDYDARFRYPGKTGQARLFQDLDVAHPRTWVFHDTDHFRREGSAVKAAGYPLVLKLDWGGEGDTVFLLQSESDLEQALSTAAAYERTGQKGFVVQAYIAHANRTLRVVVIGQTQTAYWRIQDARQVFGNSLSKGARIDTESDPDSRQIALTHVRSFSQRSRINLAGFDVIFADAELVNKDPQPLILEINYFFGRTGLGGSLRFYELLRAEIDRWLAGLGLSV